MIDTTDLTIDVEALRTQVMEIAQQILAGQHLEMVISGALLLAIIALSLTSIWRNRKRTAAAKPAATGGVMRWLTPKGTKAVTAEQAAIVAAARPRRKSGANATIKVVTPVSKVTAKLIKSSADPLEIARRSGLSRDGVAMMMATAAPKGAPKQSAPANTASSQKPARQGGNETAGRAMLAPGAYTQAQRIIPPKTERPGVGTRFNARVN